MVELTHDSRPIIGRGPPLTAWFLTLAALSVALMVADRRYHQIEQVRGWLSAAVHPVQRAVDFPFRVVDWFRGSFADRDQLREQNLELTARLRHANLQLQRFAALEDENRRLRDMRARTTGVAEKVLVATILHVDLDPFRHRVLLDKGAVDGVFRGQAVLDGEGIFGQVTRVNVATSEVILISDAEHAIPVQSVRSGVRTIAVGTGDPSKLSLPFVTVESDLKADDLLVSSGLGGIFPPGYPVGKVTAVKRAGGTFASVNARPSAGLDRSRDVLLVWFTRPPVTEPAPPEGDAATTEGAPAESTATAPARAPATVPSRTPAPAPSTTTAPARTPALAPSTTTTPATAPTRTPSSTPAASESPSAATEAPAQAPASAPATTPETAPATVPPTPEGDGE